MPRDLLFFTAGVAFALCWVVAFLAAIFVKPYDIPPFE